VSSGAPHIVTAYIASFNSRTSPYVKSGSLKHAGHDPGFFFESAAYAAQNSAGLKLTFVVTP